MNVFLVLHIKTKTNAYLFVHRVFDRWSDTYDAGLFNLFSSWHRSQAGARPGIQKWQWLIGRLGVAREDAIIKYHIISGILPTLCLPGSNNIRSVFRPSVLRFTTLMFFHSSGGFTRQAPIIGISNVSSWHSHFEFTTSIKLRACGPVSKYKREICVCCLDKGFSQHWNGWDGMGWDRK